jgi:superfamily I DNA/RNA helicase
MRVLTDVQPTAEQLPLLTYGPGFVLIRGSAGSGKTTTAVLRLRFVTGVRRREREREDNPASVRVLVLSYNRTLRGYIEELVNRQVNVSGLGLTLSTFSHWGWETLGKPEVLDDRRGAQEIWGFGSGLGFEKEFLLDEVAYVLGRFPPDRLDDYADRNAPTFDRRSRGAAPRVSRSSRRAILDTVVRPYLAWKEERGVLDWSDVAVKMAARRPEATYDVALIDEAQDFSANQVRAVVRHLSESHSTAFVLDAAQRIYPHGFSWIEAGVEISAANSFRLRANHRNTKQVTAFARPLIEGLPLDDDGTLPDFNSCLRDGAMPVLAVGRFSRQMDWIIERLRELPAGESTALLHPKGGGYFRYAEQRLREAGIPFVQMTRRQEWPQGEEQVGLSTLHSAKGLEFDHVVVLGLNGGELMPHGESEDDAQLANHRRLVAMGIARARQSVAVTYKAEEASKVIEFLGPGTYERIELE